MKQVKTFILSLLGCIMSKPGRLDKFVLKPNTILQHIHICAISYSLNTSVHFHIQQYAIVTNTIFVQSHTQSQYICELSQAGHYQKPEDVPFFPQDLPSTLFPTKSSPQVLIRQYIPYTIEN